MSTLLPQQVSASEYLKLREEDEMFRSQKAAHILCRLNEKNSWEVVDERVEDFGDELMSLPKKFEVKGDEPFSGSLLAACSKNE